MGVLRSLAGALLHPPPLDFRDGKQEWKRLFSEFVGTFFLVLVAAGVPMVMVRTPEPSPWRPRWWRPGSW